MTRAADWRPQQCCGLQHKSTWPYVERCQADATTRTHLDDYFCDACASRELVLSGDLVFEEGDVRVVQLGLQDFRVYHESKLIGTRKTFKGAIRLANKTTKGLAA